MEPSDGTGIVFNGCIGAHLLLSSVVWRRTLLVKTVLLFRSTSVSDLNTESPCPDAIRLSLNSTFFKKTCFCGRGTEWFAVPMARIIIIHCNICRSRELYASFFDFYKIWKSLKSHFTTVDDLSIESYNCTDRVVYPLDVEDYIRIPAMGATIAEHGLIQAFYVFLLDFRGFLADITMIL